MNTAKSIRYKTDGTGRDSYVTTGDGGFTNPHKVALDPRVAFQRSLRGYQDDPDYAHKRQKRLRKHIRMNSQIVGTGEVLRQPFLGMSSQTGQSFNRV